MIGKLSGTVDGYGADYIVIMTNGGVGYVVHCAETTVQALKYQSPVTVYTDLVVRDDLLQLYGFSAPVELAWYRLLSTVQGVGARASVTILGTLGVDRVKRAILSDEWQTLTTVPGIGGKLAKRLVNELKDKAARAIHSIECQPDGETTAPAGGVSTVVPTVPAAPSLAGAPDHPDRTLPSGDAAARGDSLYDRARIETDATSALVHLGYSQSDAAAAVIKTMDTVYKEYRETKETHTDSALHAKITVESVIRSALRLLSPKK